LVAGSPAIDAVNDGTCPPPAKDQRGIRRPQDGNGDGGPTCDIGSYEFVFTRQAVQAPQEPIALPPVVPDPIEPVIPDPVTQDPTQPDPVTTEPETTEPVTLDPVTTEPESTPANPQAEATSWGMSPC
jgi:hypothetical protein